MDTSLQELLRTLLQSGTESNPALNVLIDDYARYHLVLVVVGGLFLVALIVLIVFMWRRFARAPRATSRTWTFEKWVYFSFGVLSVLVAVVMAVIVAANVSTAMHPREGFAGSISMLGTPQPGTPTDAVYRSVYTWLESGSAATPPELQAQVDERLGWQRPKAIVCGVLLVVFASLSAFIWRALIRRSRDPAARWSLRRTALLLLGMITVLVCLLLMLMVMGNTQGSLAPISLTLFLG